MDYQDLNSNSQMVNSTTPVITTTEYNENEDIKEETDEEGNVTEYTYNSNDEINEHNPTAIITKPSNSTEDYNSISNENFDYDKFGNLTEEKDLINETITQTEFNSNGQVASETVKKY